VCPFDQCTYQLQESDLKRIGVSKQRLADFSANLLSLGVESLTRKRRSVPDVLVRCLNEHCGNIILVSAGQRIQMRCGCGQRPFCTRCRQAPYHHHGSCEEVQSCRVEWLDWLSGGGDRYRGQAAASANYEQQLAAMREQMERYRQLERDETWKAQNCRSCPQCRRPIERLEGCSSMKCGQDTDGGNIQPGCGANFDWSEAPPYKASVGASLRPQRKKPEEVRCRGQDVFHAGVRCDVCHTIGLRGPRFQCLHCKEFNVCMDCQPKLCGLHKADHVFRIIFEPRFTKPGMCLPLGTRVRLVRRGDTMPRTAELQPYEHPVTSLKKTSDPSSSFVGDDAPTGRRQGTPKEGEAATVLGWLCPSRSALELINHFEWKSTNSSSEVSWNPYSQAVNDHIFRTAWAGEHIVPIHLQKDTGNPLILDLNLLTLTQRNRQTRGTRSVRCIPRHPVCKYFAQGYCHLGDECGYRHVKESEVGFVRHLVRFDGGSECVVSARFLEPCLQSSDEAAALKHAISK